MTNGNIYKLSLGEKFMIVKCISCCFRLEYEIILDELNELEKIVYRRPVFRCHSKSIHLRNGD